MAQICGCEFDPSMGSSNTLTDNSQGSSYVFNVSHDEHVFYRLKRTLHVTLSHINLTLCTVEFKSYATCICSMHVWKVKTDQHAHMRSSISAFANPSPFKIKLSGLSSCERMFLFTSYVI